MLLLNNLEFILFVLFTMLNQGDTTTTSFSTSSLSKTTIIESTTTETTTTIGTTTFQSTTGLTAATETSGSPTITTTGITSPKLTTESTTTSATTCASALFTWQQNITTSTWFYVDFTQTGNIEILNITLSKSNPGCDNSNPAVHNETNYINITDLHPYREYNLSVIYLDICSNTEITDSIQFITSSSQSGPETTIQIEPNEITSDSLKFNAIWSCNQCNNELTLISFLANTTECTDIDQQWQNFTVVNCNQSLFAVNLHPLQPYRTYTLYADFCWDNDNDNFCNTNYLGINETEYGCKVIENATMNVNSASSEYNKTHFKYFVNFTWPCVNCTGPTIFNITSAVTDDCYAPAVQTVSSLNTCQQNINESLSLYLRYGRNYETKLKGYIENQLNSSQLLYTFFDVFYVGNPILPNSSFIFNKTTSTNISITIEWYPEDFNGNSNATVTIWSNEIPINNSTSQLLTCPSKNGENLTFLFTNLHPFRMYYFNLTLNNSAGNEMISLYPIQTDVGTPVNMAQIESNATETEITLWWSLPSDDCMGPTTYNISYVDIIENLTNHASFTTEYLQICNLTDDIVWTAYDLHNYRNYTFTITPITEGTNGDAGIASVYSSQTLPGPPVNYTGSATIFNSTNNSFILTWPFNAIDCNGPTYFEILFVEDNKTPPFVDNSYITVNSSLYYCTPGVTQCEQTISYGYDSTFMLSDGYEVENDQPALTAGKQYTVFITACTIDIGCGMPGSTSDITVPALAPFSTYNTTQIPLEFAPCSDQSGQISFQFNQSYFDDNFGIPITSYNIIFAPAENLSSSPEALFSVASTWDKSNDWQLPFYVTTNDSNWNPFMNINGSLFCCQMNSPVACNDSAQTSIYLIMGSDQCKNGDYCTSLLPTATNFTVVIKGNIDSENYPPVYVVALAVAEPYESPSPKNSNAGMIVGIVFGVLAFILLLLALAYFIYRKYVNKEILIKEFPKKLKDYSENSWLDLIQEYEELQSSARISFNYPQHAALMESNMPKNRFINVLPFDGSRVILNEQEFDYINASFIKGYSRAKEYIAAQAPMDMEDETLRGKMQTVSDFWTMIWQQNVTCIVMLTSLNENGRTKSACYWPTELEEPQHYGSIEVILLDETDNKHYICRKLLIRRKNDERIILHYQYVNWSDMKATDEEDLLHFVKTVRASENLSENPTLVHCSAGVGRTGTYIALDILLQQVQHNHRSISIYDCVYKLREQRVLMVQVEKQYILLYKCVGKAIEELDKTK